MEPIKCSDYNIYVNDWGAIKSFISSRPYSKLIVIVDENTDMACLPTFRSEVQQSLYVIEIKSGEAFKTIHTCEHIWKQMIHHGADRHSLCINLGGGVVGDMGGFAAATFMRGMDFIQVPTTLLSQVDASVGGKLGVDFHQYKNMVGLIKNPCGVFIFTEFLESLPYRQLLSGFAELIKHGLIADKNTYDSLLGIISLESINWAPFIYNSVSLKKRITDEDPLEKGNRKILNFGHTLGHAIESKNLNSHEPLLHGEAIAIGMVLESYLSYKKENLFLDEVHGIKAFIIKLYGHHPEKVDAVSELYPILLKDKKNKGGKILFSLLESIGRACYDQVVQKEELNEAISYYKEL